MPTLDLLSEEFAARAAANRATESSRTPAKPGSSGSAKGDESMSKSERVRRYLADHPEARNKDVAEKLAQYGVTAADVGNVKAQLKKKGGSVRGSKRASTATPAASKPQAATAAAKPAASNSAVDDLNAELGFDVIEAGVEFVKKAGGLNEAQHVLNLIRRIRNIS